MGDSTSPVLSPPPTEFPYPETDKSPTHPSLPSSDSTLAEAGSAIEQPATQGDKKQYVEVDVPIRPGLAKFRFETERPKPVGRPPSPLWVRRRATGPDDRNAVADDEFPRFNQSSNSSSSSDEDEEAMQQTRSGPENPPLSKTKLNTVSPRPRRSRNTFSLGNEHFQSKGRFSKHDGRLKLSVNETANSGYIAKALGATIHRHLRPHKPQEGQEDIERAESNQHPSRKPKLNIVIMVIGSRGDIQPFLKIGKVLQSKYGHRVRIATHPTFKKFVEQDIGLEFFSVGGDPSELMAFMVKNPGLIPSLETVKAGEIGKRRDSMYEMFQGFWRACISTTDDEKVTANMRMMGRKYPFVADAIIANPPSMAHHHCAEKLGIPLHLVFTFPYSPTSEFPHPLANIKAGNVDREYTNFMSYPLVEIMTWQGLGDLVNKFRTKTLGLEPVSTLWAAGQLSRLKVPTTYLWSPGLVPKPHDWGPEIDIAGYVFLDLASSFEAPEGLTKFLEGGDAIYIGFGSISGIDDPAAFAKLVFDTVRETGVRAVVSRGWGGMGEGMDIPDSVFMVDNIPHDWLFPKVQAVVHHGGAGTTAIGFKSGKPTMIVPFFGDQPFWGAMVAKAGAGAKRSLGWKKLTVDTFSEGIRQCLSPEAKEKAQKLAKDIEAEGDGAENAVDSFHRHLPLSTRPEVASMRCSVLEDRVAVWHLKHTTIRLSALAAELLIEARYLQWKDLELVKHHDWNDFQGPGEPITGVGGAVASSLSEAFSGVSHIPIDVKRDLKKRRKSKKKSLSKAMAIAGRVAQARVNSSAAKGGRLEDKRPDFASLNPPEQPTNEDGVLPSLQTTSTRGSEIPSAPTLIVRDTARGLGHSIKAVVLLPLDMLNAATVGLHNAPRLYGDSTVRPSPNITGVRSGFKAAGKELGYGISDGIIGVVKLPYLDIKHDGVSGIATGIGKGIGGLVIKPTAGVLGVGAYVGKGFHVGLRKRVRDTKRTERWIRRARIDQGNQDVRELERKRDIAGSPDGATTKGSKDELQSIRASALTRWKELEKQVKQERDEHARTMGLRPQLPRLGAI